MPTTISVYPDVRDHPERAVALETTLLLHGVPREAALGLADELDALVRSHGAIPATVGVVSGVPTVGLTRDQLEEVLASQDRGPVAKANTANLGVLMHRGTHGATTVSATMELAHGAGVRVFATGGIGGVHAGYARRLDVSSDLGALARFPVAVVASGVKSILDVESTREALETLGVPVVGYRTDRFPAFYQRESGAGVDARFDDEEELADFVRFELARTGRGLLIANPVPPEHHIEASEFDRWRLESERIVAAHGARGRDVTPAALGALHEISGGRTLESNLALVRSNADLASRLQKPRF
ncbi:MAG: pseudouridine-5'-phosphate glycosidase [Phycisphaerales bacterium JB040]